MTDQEATIDYLLTQAITAEKNMQIIITTLLICLLLSAAVIDIRKCKIPNNLCIAVLILGIVKISTAPFSINSNSIAIEALSAIAGMLVGLVSLGIIYLRGVMGAGDVKLMAATGFVVGFSMSLWALAYTLVAGGIMAIALFSYLILHRHLSSSDSLRLKLNTAGAGIITGAYAFRCHRFPYALAITTGAILAIIFHGH